MAIYPTDGEEIASRRKNLQFFCNLVFLYVWALILAPYSYKIQLKLGSQHNNADMLSRLPLPASSVQIPTLGETILLLDMLH